MQDQPSASELLTAIADALTNDVVPACEGGERHTARVAASLCRQIQRDLDQDPAVRDQHEAALRQLSSASSSATEAEVAAELDQRLRTADTTLRSRALPILLADARRRAELARPGYTEPFAAP